MTALVPTIVVSILGPLFALVGIRVAWLNLRDTRTRERAVPCHERAATQRFDDGAHAFLYARSLLALAERAEDPVDRDQLVAAAHRMTDESQAMFETCAALMREHAA